MKDTVNEVEQIKARSNYLRGTLEQSLADELSGALSPDDTQLSKFHGLYQQDDRDVRRDRRQALLEPYYRFMLRARLPGGVCRPEQWLVIDRIGQQLANGTLRLTTRQTFQFHGILKHNLKPTIQEMNRVLLDSIGGCGDVNRNVCCNPNPMVSRLHQDVYGWAKRLSEHLLPRTRAYHELWLDEEKVAASEAREPLYGPTYLPRKFKIAIAVPPHNDVDVYANDLGFVAIAEGDRLLGFNVLAGGGMGTTQGDTSTFPRLADVLGFIEPDQTLRVAEAVLTVQRDFGNRRERTQSRLKYTIERLGLKAFRAEVEKRAGVVFGAAHAVHFTDHGDRFGWVSGTDGRWYLTLFIENGRVADGPERQALTGLREIAQVHKGDFRVTASQNLVIAGVPDEEKATIQDLAIEYGLLRLDATPLRRNSMACVALPTCPQAMAEAERYFPQLLDRIDTLTRRHGIGEREIVVRMTGCPNGCARPFLAEIGLIGRAPGKYNLYLGGDGVGTRLNKLYKNNLDESGLLEILDELLRRYATQRLERERFGDFVIRAGIVAAVTNAAVDFHA